MNSAEQVVGPLHSSAYNARYADGGPTIQIIPCGLPTGHTLCF